ncbi:MAG: glycosyltransferase [Anaerolineales bacterium]|nr:glycosyltransferase [Anaerolineales bacterium]
MSQSVHVLHVIDSLTLGGAEVQVSQLVRGLQQHGHFRVSLCYSTPGPLEAELTAAGVPLTRLRRRARLDPALLFGICQVIRRDPPQIVHTHLFKSDMHGRLAGRLCGVPVVLSSLRNCDAWAQRPLLGRVYGATAALTDHLVAVSEDVRQYHIRYSHLPPAKVTTIENGVDVRRFAGQAEAGHALRRELGVSPETPLIGMVGRLKPQKDPSMFLEAAARIRQAQPHARFWMVGDGPLRADLGEQTRQLGLAEAVTFCGVRQDIPAVLAALDVLTLTSRWEGLPGTVLEGMAAGRPVVATAAEGTRSVVVDGETGLLVPVGDAPALAAACLRILADPALGQRLGQAGQRRAQARYSLTALVDRTVALYNDWLSRKTGRAAYP